MSEKEKNDIGNQVLKRNFSKKEDINKIKSSMKRFRRKNTNRRHLDEKNEIRYIPRVNDRNRHVDREVDGKEEKMYVIPLGGIEEVGKNMTAFQYKDEIIVVDAGLTFPEDEHLGIDVIIPDFSYLESNKQNKRITFNAWTRRPYWSDTLFLSKIRFGKYSNVRWKIDACISKSKI